MAKMITSDVQIFKSKFCQWAQSNLPNDSARRFTISLNQVLTNFLPETDNLHQILIRNLVDSKELSFSFFSNELLVAPDIHRRSLTLGLIMPSWDRGLQHICRDEHVYDTISWFFHYASQYVARSRMVDVIASINLIYERVCDIRGNRMTKYLLENNSDKEEFISAFKSQASPKFNKKYSSREKQLCNWINKSNSLDPYIHRIHFNFLHACKLLSSEFYEEAITSLDKTVDVIQQYSRERMNINGINDQRELTLIAFKMTDWERHLLARLYDIRNFFGGHPSMSKWWDFSEIFDEDIDDLFQTVKKLIFKVLSHENSHRVVAKYPSRWSIWFADNALMLWDTVWFEKIQKNIR